MKGLQEIPAREVQEQTSARKAQSEARIPVGITEEELALITWLGEGGAVRPED